MCDTWVPLDARHALGVPCTNAVKTLLAATAGLAVSARGPVIDRPLRPARPPRRRTRDLTAVEFGGVGHLELLPPLVQLGLAHREGLVRCRRLAMCDAG